MAKKTEQQEPTKLLYTPIEASRVLSISRTTLYELMAAGEIRWVKIGKSRRVPYSELQRYVAELLAA